MRCRPLLVLLCSLCVGAEELPGPHQPPHLDFQQGTVQVGDGLATIALGEELRYLAGADARFVVERVWGNPPDPSILGLILPIPAAAAEEEPEGQDGGMADGTAPEGTEQEGTAQPPADPVGGWGIVVSWDGSGHVEDGDAAGIDYDGLLQEMRDGIAAGSEERARAGYPRVELLGWAEPPHYDAATHKLYWAKSLRFGGSPHPELNYCVRILGARGVLELNAVAALGDLARVAEASRGVLAATALSQGHRYEDYQHGIDPVAAGGITALVAGGLLAKKVGLLALVGAFLLKGWKLVMILGFGLLVLWRKLAGGRS